MKPLTGILMLTGLAAAGSLPFARDGLIDTPDISLLDHTEIRVGSAFTMFSYEDSTGQTESDFAVAGHIEFGLFDIGQIGLCYLGKGGISGHLKLVPIKESLDLPGIAIGVQNITGEENYEFYEQDNGELYGTGSGDKQNFSAYIVLTKDLRYVSGIPVDISLGYGIGRFQPVHLDTTESSSFIPGLFCSTRIRFSPEFNLMLEWDGRDANAGVEYSFNSLITFQGAVTEIEEMLTSSETRDKTDVMQNMKFGIGVELTFGPLYRPSVSTTMRQTEIQQREALSELEALRKQAEEELRRMQELLEH